MDHPPDEQLVAWAAGELNPERERSVELHADACPDCAARLTGFAQQEQALFAVAEASRRRSRTRRIPGWAWGSLAFVAVAAAALVMLRPASSPPSAGAVEAVVQIEDMGRDCSLRADIAECEEEAANQGLWVPSAPVPRYEAEQACTDCGRSG